jgi:hypothetical protein
MLSLLGLQQRREVLVARRAAVAGDDDEGTDRQHQGGPAERDAGPVESQARDAAERHASVGQYEDRCRGKGRRQHH